MEKEINSRDCPHEKTSASSCCMRIQAAQGSLRKRRCVPSARNVPAAPGPPRLQHLQSGTDCTAYDTTALREALPAGQLSITSGEMTSFICENLAITWGLDGKSCYYPGYRIGAQINGEPASMLVQTF